MFPKKCFSNVLHLRCGQCRLFWTRTSVDECSRNTERGTIHRVSICVGRPSCSEIMMQRRCGRKHTLFPTQRSACTVQVRRSVCTVRLIRGNRNIINSCRRELMTAIYHADELVRASTSKTSWEQALQLGFVCRKGLSHAVHSGNKKKKQKGGSCCMQILIVVCYSWTFYYYTKPTRLFMCYYDILGQFSFIKTQFTIV